MAQPRDNHLAPDIWGKKMIEMQWQLFGDCIDQLTGFVPTAVQKTTELIGAGKLPTPLDWFEYSLDSAQRFVITLDTLRERGNQYFEHEAAGLPPVLTFEYRTLIDARDLARPAAYALLELIPPAGITIDPDRRPFVIVDPRAGHGPGIGGFKADSEVGEAFRAGHPVYMVSFYPQPMPNQTLGDVAAAEAIFLEEVARRHPNAGKPIVIGNCQGGWAVMGLAATRPGLTGPIVINGAPLSYWAGASGKNPMRYNGGLFGGSWMCQWMCDLGNGKFDGAHLVSNFENLDLANTFWKKPFNLLTNVDKEAGRFLEFERWWNGHYTLNSEEMRAIVEELFVGNRLASGEITTADGKQLDLRNIRAPIVVFASSGDNITPPEQALNWIADVYGDTREIIANGQVIVYLKHASVGHLGIFVSGAVAIKEHRQIISLVEHIEKLVPGLYEMVFHPAGTPENPTFEVVLENREIADIVTADRDSREDELEFGVVKNVSDINSRIYDAFCGPIVRSMVGETTANVLRNGHPARLKHYVLSDKNPVMKGIEGAAKFARQQRHPASPENPVLAWRELLSQSMIHWLDSMRVTRDTMAENMFYAAYGWMRVLGLGDAYGQKSKSRVQQQAAIESILERISTGGIVEAIARALVISQRAQGTMLPARVARAGQQLRALSEFAGLTPEALQRILHEQTVIVAYAPEQAEKTLADLLSTEELRARAAQIIRELIANEDMDPRFIQALSSLGKNLGLEPLSGGKSKKSSKQNETRTH